MLSGTDCLGEKIKVVYIKSKRELREEEKQVSDSHESRRQEFVRLLADKLPELRYDFGIGGVFVEFKKRCWYSWFTNPVIEVYLSWTHNFTLGIHVYEKEYFKAVSDLVIQLETKYDLTGKMNGHTIWIEYE